MMMPILCLSVSLAPAGYRRSHVFICALPVPTDGVLRVPDEITTAEITCVQQKRRLSHRSKQHYYLL